MPYNVYNQSKKLGSNIVSTTATIEGLIPSSTYVFDVTETDGADESGKSNYARVVTKGIALIPVVISISDIKSLTYQEDSIGVEIEDYNTFNAANVNNKTNMTILNRDQPETSPGGFEVVGLQASPRSIRIAQSVNRNGKWRFSGWARGSQGVAPKFWIDINDLGSVFSWAEPSNEWTYFSATQLVNNYTDIYSFCDLEGMDWAYYFFKDVKIECLDVTQTTGLGTSKTFGGTVPINIPLADVSVNLLGAGVSQLILPPEFTLEGNSTTKVTDKIWVMEQGNKTIVVTLK